MAKITLEAARVNAGLTQAEMADKLGVSRELVIGFETDDLLLPLKYAKSVQ